MTQIIDEAERAESSIQNIISANREMKEQIAGLTAEKEILTQTVTAQLAELKDLEDFRGLGKKPPKKLTFEITDKVLVKVIPVMVARYVGAKGNPEAQRTEEGKERAMQWINRFVTSALRYVFTDKATLDKMVSVEKLVVLEDLDKEGDK